MNKYHITLKSIIGKILVIIPFLIVVALFYFLNKYPLAEDQSLVLEAYMFFEIGFILLMAGTTLIFFLLVYFVVKSYKFYDDDEFIVIEKGIIFKRQVKILYKNINTIAIKRNLLDLIIKIAKVEIDSGTTAAPEPEGKLILNLEYAKYLKTYLENKKTNNELELLGPKHFDQVEEKEENVVYQAKNYQLILMGLLKPGFLAIAVTAILALSSYGNIIFLYGEDVNVTWFKALATFCLIILGIVIVLALLFIILHYFKYYNYRLIDHGDNLEYQYGLLSRTTFKFKKNRINAVYLKQSLLFKLFKLYSIEASIIGIGDAPSNDQKNEIESRYVLPVGKFNQVENILSIVDAKELLNENLDKPTKKRKLNFIVLPMILPTILFVATIIVSLVMSKQLYFVLFNAIVVYAIIIISLCLRLKKQGINIDSKILIRKGFYTTTKVLIRKSRIQTVSYSTGPVNQLIKLGDIRFNYKRVLGVINIKGFDYNEFNKIKDKVFNKA